MYKEPSGTDVTFPKSSVFRTPPVTAKTETLIPKQDIFTIPLPILEKVPVVESVPIAQNDLRYKFRKFKSENDDVVMFKSLAPVREV